MNLVRTIASNYHLPYFTISPTFSVCPQHGYLNGEHFHCPICAEQERLEITKKINELEKEKQKLSASK